MAGVFEAGLMAGVFVTPNTTYASICGFVHIKLSNIIIRHTATINNEQLIKSRLSDHH